MQPVITIGGRVEKPYYQILYFDILDNDWHLGFGSYNLANVQKWYEEELEIVADTVEVKKDNESIKINLNEFIKVKLTDFGKEIYYHQLDDANERIKNNGFEPITPRLPKVDNEGYTKMQLWRFMQLYGNYIGMGLRDVITPIELIYDPSKGKV